MNINNRKKDRNKILKWIVFDAFFRFKKRKNLESRAFCKQCIVLLELYSKINDY